MAGEGAAGTGRLFLDTSLIIVATMLAHGLTRLATRNAKDFARYANLIYVDAIG